MKRICGKLPESEKGQALLIVLMLLFFTGLVVAPALANISTSVNAVRGQGDKMALSYAADAGLEDALWQINNDGIPIDPGDYVTEYNYSLPQDINSKPVDINVKQIWPLVDLESDAHGTTLPSSLLITGGVIDVGEGKYKVQASYDGSEDDLYVDRIAVWLPPGVNYATGSSTGLTTDDPTVADWHGGKTLIWTFDPAVNFTDLTIPEPPGGGFTPGTEYPAVRKLYFNITPTGDIADGSFCWIRTTNADLYLAWESGCNIYQISSTATDPVTGKSITVEGFTYRTLGSALGSGGFQIQGDYRAIGNTMMKDIDEDWVRETFVDVSSANITDIPADAEVVLAYLYWSGCRKLEDEMKADKYVGLKVNGNSVYFNESDNATLGELPTSPTTEILRPNASGSYNETYRSSGYSSRYRYVDEAVADDSSTYVYSKNGYTLMDTYNIENRTEATGTINSVTVYARGRAYNSGACDDMRMEIVLRTDSTGRTRPITTAI